MLKHNLLLFFRNIRKNKTTFLINLIGLSTGLACALMIALWVNDELQIDKYHENGDQLVQILQNLPTPNGIETDDATQGPLAEALVNEFPEVEKSVNVLHNAWFEGEKFFLSNGGDQFFSTVIHFAGKDYFNMFSFPLLQGKKDQVLASSNAVVISEKMAKKLFPTEDAMGKAVEWLHDEFGGTYTVTGIFKELPKNATDQFDVIFNIDVFIDQNEDLREWGDSDVQTFALLHPGTDLTKFNLKIKDFLKTKNEYFPETYLAQPYSERYLYGNYENGKVSGGRIQYVKLFSIIALLILIIACVNFINISTARASTRIKEIGVKKSVGAKRKDLMIQFTAEALLTTGISMILALIMVSLFLPQFNLIAGKELDFSLNANFLTGIFLITIGAGLAAGVYPALYLSGLSALKGLKGKVIGNLSGSFGRKGLVVFQFVTSAVLIVAVFIIYNQMEFIQNKNLGFNKNNIIWFPSGVLEENLNRADAKGMSSEDIENFLQILKNTPGVVNASNFRHTMMADFGTTTGLDWPGKDLEKDALFAQIAGGFDFIETMQIELREGRTYSREYSTETEKIIFNEAAVEQLGMKEPIGKTISLWGEDREIVGVVKDFHIDRLYQKVLPVFMTLSQGNFASNFMVRVAPGNEAATIARIKKAYQEYFIEGMPFDFHFLNKNYERLYQAEKQVADLSKYFAGIATLISCLGLFGLAVFTTQRRRKEISIRKVLGQTATQVVTMLSGEFAKLVLLAILIALPIAYLLAENWLSGFAYHISLKVQYFFGAGLVVMLVAMLTVGSQAFSAANRNPVKSLREE
ncbi:MAG: ABC transporter permease [Flavobacteriaceae bacterium]